MTTARSQQIHPGDTPYYHCIARCVRRAFLCGDDRFSGKNYDHRKQWIVDKIKELSNIFCIDVCAFAVMSNHYHLVLHINDLEASNLNNDAVINRWYQLFNGHMIVDRYKKNEKLTKAELTVVNEIIETWRNRLTDISWFMRCLNESIARQSNKEDNCKGRFWEGRFKSQALLDETALLTCMMYVDLNPVRAGISESLEDSDFTSIQKRIAEYAVKQKPSTKERLRSKNVSGNEIDLKPLFPFIGNSSMANDSLQGIQFSLQDYLELTDWTGRVIREDKKGAIPDHIQPILQKLGVQQDNWVKQVQHFGRQFGRIVGPIDLLASMSDKLGKWWLRGTSSCRCLYQSSNV